jgi:hypothetical protein
MLWKMLRHVHTSYILCSWQLGSKGEVVADLEKEKAALVPDQTMDPTPAPCPVRTVQRRRGDGTVATELWLGTTCASGLWPSSTCAEKERDLTHRRVRSPMT